MVNIKTLPDRIIFDGHADTKQECETITLMCDGLACNNNFRTVAYRKGYAEFEKVGSAERLQFLPGLESFSIINSKNNDEVAFINADSYPEEITFNGKNLYLMSTAGQANFMVGNVNSEYVESYQDFTSDDGLFDGCVIVMKEQIAAYNSTTNAITFVEGGTTMINIDLTTLSGYSTLTKGSTYSLTVKAKAQGYQDSDASAAVSYTVPQPQLAAPTITASDTTITWDAIENADSYDVYVDGELYENVTGGG